MSTRLSCRVSAVLVLLAAGSSPVWAQIAVRVSEPAYFSGTTGSGARALGMGGAFIAIADDATASSWNPAGLCVLEKPEASLVAQPIARVKTTSPGYAFGIDSRFTSPTSTQTTVEVEEADPYDLARDGRSFDFASVTIPLRLGSIKLVPQISYQRAVDMGLDYEYRQSYADDIARDVRSPAGAQLSTTVETGGGSYRGTGDVSGGLDVIGLSTGIGVSSKIYLGLALNIWRNGSDARTTYNFERNSTSQSVSGTTASTGAARQTSDQDRTTTEEFRGTNFQVGVLVKPKSWLSVGATYKSAFDMDYEYRFESDIRDVFRSTTGSGSTANTLETTTNTHSSVSRSGLVTWPASFGGGIAVMPKETLTISFDATLIQWSKAKIMATETFQSNGTRNQVRTIGTSPQSPQSLPFTPGNRTSQLDFPWPVYSSVQTTQPDALQVRLGAEYVLRNPGVLGLQVLPLRVGLLRDRQIQRNYQDETDVYHTGLAVGLGLTWSRVSLDFAYLLTRGSRNEDYVLSNESSTPPTSSRSTQVMDVNDETTYRASRFFVSTTVRF